MFRVWYQAVLRILLVSLGLLVCGAVAQDQPDQKSTDKPAQDTAGAPAQAQPADAVDPLKRPANEKQRKKNQRALKQELSKPTKSGWTRTSSTSSPTRSARPSSKSPTTRSATTSLKPSGSVATLLLTPKKTNIRKSTTSASPTPTNISRLASQDGKPIAVACTSCLASPMKSNLTPRAEVMNVPWTRAAARLRPFPLKIGGIATSKGSARK